jgi:hypothetical protein
MDDRNARRRIVLRSFAMTTLLTKPRALKLAVALGLALALAAW